MNKTAANRWTTLDAQRQEVLNRAEEAARVTIPALFVKEGHTESTKLPTPYQGLGARAVNSLSSKMLLALFPPNSKFFKIGLTDSIKTALTNRGVNVDEVESSISDMESEVVDALEASTLRIAMKEVMLALLVTGNRLLKLDKDLSFTSYCLRSYVVSRDPKGNVLEVVLKEEVSPETLPEEVREYCKVDSESREKTCHVYTSQVRDGKQYRVFQEINGIVVPGSEGKYPLDAPLLLPIRWTSVHGENYGRGMVTEYIGDFNSLDDLSRDLLKGSAAAAKILYLRDPNSVTTAKKFATSKSGDVIDGKEGDFRALTMDKYADFRVTLERVNAISEELKAAFLMHQSVSRNAERVTAEEIRFLAQELESTLGGSYSILAGELQLPLLRRTLSILTSQNRLPSLPKGNVRYTVTTGLEALGRGHDLNMLLQFIRVVREVVGEEGVQSRLKIQKVINQIAASMGISAKELVASEQEVAAAAQQAQMRQAVEKIGPGVAREMVRNQGQAA